MTGPLTLRVLTFNIHGGRPARGPADLAETARVIRELEPDLAGLQEVGRWVPWLGFFQDQPRRLRKLLPLRVTFRPSFGLGGAGFGNAVLSPVPPAEVRRIRLPATGTPAALQKAFSAVRPYPWHERRRRLRDVLEPRTLLVTWFKPGGRPIRVLNTHLGLSGPERLAQACRIAEEVRSEDSPTLLLGDLNAVPASAEVDALEAAGLAHCVPPEVASCPAVAPVVRLDYIMASRHFLVERGWSVETRASDHLPLVADVVLVEG